MDSESQIEQKLTEFVTGALTELIAQLNGVTPEMEYEQVRQLCRKAAQTIQTFRDSMTDE